MERKGSLIRTAVGRAFPAIIALLEALLICNENVAMLQFIVPPHLIDQFLPKMDTTPFNELLVMVCKKLHICN